MAASCVLKSSARAMRALAIFIRYMHTCTEYTHTHAYIHIDHTCMNRSYIHAYIRMIHTYIHTYIHAYAYIHIYIAASSHHRVRRPELQNGAYFRKHDLLLHHEGYSQ